MVPGPSGFGWMGLDVDLREFAKAIRTLEVLSERAVPYAAREGLNAIAFGLQREWQGQIRRAFVLRNNFTVRSVRVEKAAGLDLAAMRAVVGSVAPYMAEQEFGATHTKKGKHGVPVPTSSAAGQAPGASRTRPVQRRNYHSAIRLRARISGTRERKNAAAIAQAVRSGNRTAFIETATGRKGIVRITGTRTLKVRMIWDLSRDAVRTKPEPTLGRAMKIMDGRSMSLMTAAVESQIERALKHRR